MLRNDKAGFGWITITLHWTIAALILALLALGYIMRRLPVDPALQFSLYQWHKSLGFTVLGLAVIRTIWHLIEIAPRAPESLSGMERRAAGATHALLLALALAVPLAGWAVASTSTLNIPSFYFNWFIIPHLPMAKSASAEGLWTLVHMALAYLLLAFVALHILAALYHHIVRHDEILVRMFHTGSRQGASSQAAGSDPMIAGRKKP
ncbi:MULTISPECIES: cytochrome b [unclassified Ensifer]|uniref:cytochrome b n=1 Tax=unclassified Ensifer TaxID=2633371 RepID=UPI0008137654|nr:MULTISPECIES: cytochrome b [unclassified Ensifer]OCP01402.1 cytochrome B [Ensifer sp. LC14]OCP05444.1 cytochrome B [Ensifer sp. LC11]OCP06061.1 cytochrome B [Ensifer sp. LC13]OCP30883.1 cytochrome B [Ensifer sp. LC499]